MGTYTIGEDELSLELIKFLDELEGEVYLKDFKKAAKKIINLYPNFTK